MMRSRILTILSPLILGAILWGEGTHAFPEPELEWTYQLPVGLEAVPVPYPSENPNSVLYGTGGRVFRISGDGELIFDSAFGPEISRGGIYDVALGDIDGDGEDEIIHGHNAGYVYALNADTGKVLWEFNVGAEFGTWRMASPVDLDGDGRTEVVAPDKDGWVTTISHDGNLLWRSKVEQFRISTPAVGDIDNDGEPEIVYGTATRYLIALDSDGRLLWRHFEPPHHMGRTFPLIADLDGDTNSEVYSLSSMIGRDVGVVSLNGADGSKRWVGATWHKAYHARGAIQFSDGTHGFMTCDKGSNLCAYQADGKLRWKSHVDGRGIYSVPACGDLDGDGSMEIVVAVRDSSRDGLQNTWYVLSNEGEQLGGYSLKRGFGGAAIADIDRDGELEVVISASAGPGLVHCFSFGGKATPDSVYVGSWRDPVYPQRSSDPVAKETEKAPSIKLVESLPDGRYGNNSLTLTLPETHEGIGVEVMTTSPDGTRMIRVFQPEKGESSVDVYWPVAVVGDHEVAFRLLNLEFGKVLGEQTLTANVPDLLAVIQAEMGLLLNSLVETEKTLTSSSLEVVITYAKLRAQIEAKLQALSVKISGSADLSPTDHRALAKETGAFLDELQRAKALSALITSEVAEGRTPKFALWQDNDPWDNDDPLDDLPEKGGEPKVSAWAFGNEIESVGINVVNLSPDGLTLRVEPGTVRLAGATEVLRPAREVAGLHRAIPTPSRFGEIVPDVLPPIGEHYLLDIAPGEVQRLWINLSSKNLEPGDYEISWPVRTMDTDSYTLNLTIRFDVSPVRVPDKSGYLINFWAQSHFDDLSTTEDLSNHLQTIWYGLPLPPAEADAEGNLIGELDWSKHDGILDGAKQVELILYHGLPMPKTPEGVEVTDELRLAAQRNYAKEFVAHLKTLDLGYENIMFYVEDETGLSHGPASYLKRASHNKKIDPNFQNYANPWGGITVEQIREMWPLTDVWQPGMETIEYLGKEFVDAMRKGGKRITTYTPPDNVRILRPLGFYRAQGWQAHEWGIEGGGWFIYKHADLWSTTREPDFGAVSWDGRALVTSRRWEATRDGSEDYDILCMLRDGAENHGDEEARKVYDEAVNYVAGITITGMPREAADYDLDFPAFMEHRTKIREALERMAN